MRMAKDWLQRARDAWRGLEKQAKIGLLFVVLMIVGLAFLEIDHWPGRRDG